MGNGGPEMSVALGENRLLATLANTLQNIHDGSPTRQNYDLLVHIYERLLGLCTTTWNRQEKEERDKLLNQVEAEKIRFEKLKATNGGIW